MPFRTYLRIVLTRFLSLIVGVLLFTQFLTGCAGGSADMAFNYYLTREEPLLDKGPYQQEPPRRILPIGTRVRIISSGGSYVYVGTTLNETGWVPVSSLHMQDSNDNNNVAGARKSYSGW